MARQPTTLSNEMTTKAMLVPRSSWSWLGSVASCAVRAPTEWSSASKKATDLERMLLKYSPR